MGLKVKLKARSAAGKAASLVLPVVALLVVCAGVMLVSGCADIANSTANAVKITANAANNAVPGGTATSELAYYFPRDGQHPDRALISVINSSRSNLDIAIYSITLKSIVNAIASAEKRGVAVRIITDKTEAADSSQRRALLNLEKDGISIKINTHPGLMHMKVTIADGSTVTTGSYNYTAQATDENDEVLVVINNPSVSKDFDRQFSRMWNDTADFANFNP